MKTLQDINYVPLKEVQGAFSREVRDAFKVPPLVVYAIALIVTAVAVYYVGQVAVYALFVGLAYFGKRASERKSRAWSAFAEANGWYVIPNAGATNSLFVPPGLQGIGRSCKLSTVVHASFEGHECDLAMYQFTIGSGKNSSTHYYTVARVILMRPFPHIILDSKSSWAIRERGTAQHHVSLEGNFDKHFSLYCEPGEHIDALSIVTPDIMSTLIDNNRPQDIEIMDNNLYFMTAQDKRGADALPELLRSIDALSDQIVHKAKTLRYTPPEGSNPHTGRATSAIASYFRSGQQVQNSLSRAVLFIVFLPLLLLILMGFMSWLIQL